MQTKTIHNNRYPESREYFFTNFVISQWFVIKVAEVTAEGDPKRIKRYAAMNPSEMILEPPIIFDLPNKRFHSCVVDRQAGVLIPDQLIPQVDFICFLEKSNKSKNINLNGDYNQETITLVKEGVNLNDIIAIIDNPERLSTDPIFHLTKEKGTDNYLVIFDHTDNDFTFDMMVSWVFNDYTFEDITMSVLEESDPEYPNGSRESLAELYGGKIILFDSLLIEQTITFNFINLPSLLK